MPLPAADVEAARELGRSLAPPTPAEGALMSAIWIREPAVEEPRVA